jgi:dTDP-4-dehydrorhamnose 3,5-epimerase
MQVKPTVFPEVLLIAPKVFADNRGFFYESFYQSRYAELGITKNFVQDNLSRSYKNVVRGLHYQVSKPQAKLVSVVYGEVYDVVVDIRPGSKTFGQWSAHVLNDTNHHQLYIPEGFAHGFCVLSEFADFMYKCTDYYFPEGDRGIRWDDPNIGIEWPIDKTKAILSEKDLRHPLLKVAQ